MMSLLKDESSPRKIEIEFNGRTLVIADVVDNTIKQSYITSNFPIGSKLVYQIDGQPALLEYQDDLIILKKNVNKYTIDITNSKFEQVQKSSLFEDLLNTLKKRATTVKKIPVNKNSIRQRVVNKKQEDTNDLTEEVLKPTTPKNRVIHTSWRHKTYLGGNYIHYGPQLAPIKKIHLDGNINYSLLELQQEMIKQYKTEDHSEYFDRSMIKLGDKNMEWIPDFKNKDGKACSFWEYRNDVIMEYFESNSLSDLIFDKTLRKFPFIEKNLNRVGYQICCAVSYLHSLKIIHRDIKPANILVNEHGIVKLCDFGLALIDMSDAGVETTHEIMAKGTYLYMPPEKFFQREKASTLSDVWSLAATLVEMYSQERIWDVSKYTHVYQCVNSNFLVQNVPDVSSTPAALQPKLLKSFDYIVSERPSCAEILDTLKTLPGCSKLANT